MTTRDLGYIALFAALIVALGIVPAVPVSSGVPLTLQSLGVMLAGLILGPKRGALSVLVVIALVMIGLPVLSGGRGGVAVFAGKTTGFLAGWVIGAYLTGWIADRASGVTSRASSWLLLAILGLSIGSMFGIAALKLAEIFGLEAARTIGVVAFTSGLALAIVAIVSIERRFEVDTTGFRVNVFAAVAGGIVVVHALGIAWNMFYFRADLTPTFLGFSFPFIPGDVIKAVVAALVTIKVRDAFALERK